MSNQLPRRPFSYNSETDSSVTNSWSRAGNPSNPFSPHDTLDIPEPPPHDEYENPSPASSSFDFGESTSRITESYTTTSHVPTRADDAESLVLSGDRRLVVAFDFGTTYTGAAVVTPLGDSVELDDIVLVTNWGDKMQNDDKIPSVISYSASTSNEQQWGNDVSPDAICMVHQKLELAIGTASDELDFLLKTMEGVANLDFEHLKRVAPMPAYTTLRPEEIVSDYIERAFKAVAEFIDQQYTEAFRINTPVEIVMTTPADWPHRARNATYRALVNAGANTETFPKLGSVMSISEPEAAAIYTARYLSESPRTKKVLRKDQSFVLCDAGGGTVDVVSYRVCQLDPLQVEKMTLARSDKCGSSFVNLEFQKWLYHQIGWQNYRALDPRKMNFNTGSHDMEGSAMRILMKKFDEKKKQFKDDPRPIRLDLPSPLDNLNLPGIDNGQITISKGFFERSVDGIVRLIEEQIQSTRIQRREAQNVLLIGGFAESVYLQNRLKMSLNLRRIGLQIPETSWTAVVRGAALCGVENLSSRMTIMEPWKRCYGVCVSKSYSVIDHFDPNNVPLQVGRNGQMLVPKTLTWIAKMGDIVSSTTEQNFNLNISQNQEKRGFLQLYSYEQEDNPPEALEGREAEVKHLASLKWDMTTVDISQLSRATTRGSKLQRGEYVANCLLTMILRRGNTLEFTLTWKNRVIGFMNIPY